jgi:SPP1 family holin
MKKETIIRTVVLGVALFNQVLMINGKSIFPVSENEISEAIGIGFTIVTAVVAWWKNNSFTAPAIEADKYLEQLRSGDAE